MKYFYQSMKQILTYVFGNIQYQEGHRDDDRRLSPQRSLPDQSLDQ